MNRGTTDNRNFRTFLLVSQIDPGAIQERIRQARRESDLTQQELADLIDRHKRTVENYENVRVPDWPELTKIARVLNRPIEWFLHGDTQTVGLDDILAKLTDLENSIQALDRKFDLEVATRLESIENNVRELSRAETTQREY